MDKTKQGQDVVPVASEPTKPATKPYRKPTLATPKVLDGFFMT